MSYDRQRYVADGSPVIYKDDIYARTATKGPLLHGADASGVAHSVRVRDTHEMTTMDLETGEVMRQILNELKKMNIHLLSITDEHISETDIDSTY